MSLPNFGAWFFSSLASPAVQQIAPLLVILLIPILVVLTFTQGRRNSLLYSGAMVLESLGLGLPWSWSNGRSSMSGPTHERKKSKKKHVRTRAEQIGLNGNARHDSVHEGKDPEEGYYPGLVNVSGTYCFMNSTLQAMASLCYLQPHIDVIHAKAEALDVPSPVIDALQELLHVLNSPRSSPSSIRPLEMISALSNHAPKNNSLFNSHEHQDAQELFQLLSECIKNETAAVDKEGYRDRGLGGLVQLGETSRDIGKSVFDGLTANRRSCVECGYTEAVMHFAFDNWQLAVPRLVATCQLEDCLTDYTRLEVLTDCICRKCSILATHKRLVHEAEKISEAAKDDSASPSRKKRAREARKLAALVKTAIDEGRIEDDIHGVRMEKVFSKASTKQAMIARPPPILVLHINRSVHFGQYASKNTVRVLFPETLDLTPFTTSGKLSTHPSVPISSPPPSVLRSTTPTPATYGTPRVMYRLSSVVCHYGQHSFGHYICYRRKPRPASSGPRRFLPPKLVDPLPYDGAGEQTRLIWEDEHDMRTRPRWGWLRISDESVSECGIETVLQENAGVFMLYYERVLYAPGVYPPNSSSPGSSEETLKPEMVVHHANGSASSLLSVGGVGAPCGGRGREGEREREQDKSVVGPGKVLGPRIVRSVAAGRGRSTSAAPSERESSVTASTSSEMELTPKRGVSPLPPPNGVVPDGSAVPDGTKAPAESESSESSEWSISRPQLIVRQVSRQSSSSSTSVLASPSASVSSHHPRDPPPPRIQSPQPIHAPAGPSMVGLRA